MKEKLKEKFFCTNIYFSAERDEDVYEGVNVLIKEDEVETFKEIVGEIFEGFETFNLDDNWKNVVVIEDEKGETFDEGENFFIKVERTRRSGHGRFKRIDGAVTVVRRWKTHSAKMLCGMTHRTAQAVEELCKVFFDKVVVRVATDADLDLD